MANKTGWLVGAGIVALVFAAYKSSGISKSLNYLQYQIAGLKFNFKNWLQPEIIFSISVTNPNDTGIPVEKFFGNVKNGSSIIANFNSTSPISLAGGETATIDVSAKVNALSVAMQLLNGSKVKSLTIEGLIKTGFFDQKFTKEVAIPGMLGSVEDRVGMFQWFRKNKKLKTAIKVKKPFWFRHNSFFNHGFLQYPKRGMSMGVKGTYN
jgi:LEA14-like dessication related protein